MTARYPLPNTSLSIRDIFASYGEAGTLSLSALRNRKTFASDGGEQTIPPSGAISLENLRNRYTYNPTPVTNLTISTWPPNNLPANKPPLLKFSLDMRAGGGRGSDGGFRGMWGNGGSSGGNGGQGGRIITPIFTLSSPNTFRGSLSTTSPRAGGSWGTGNGEGVYFDIDGNRYQAGGGSQGGRGDGNGGSGGFVSGINSTLLPGSGNYCVNNEAGSGGQGQGGEWGGGGWPAGPYNGFAGYVKINLYYIL